MMFLMLWWPICYIFIDYRVFMTPYGGETLMPVKKKKAMHHAQETQLSGKHDQCLEMDLMECF